MKKLIVILICALLCLEMMPVSAVTEKTDSDNQASEDIVTEEAQENTALPAEKEMELVKTEDALVETEDARDTTDMPAESAKQSVKAGLGVVRNTTTTMSLGNGQKIEYGFCGADDYPEAMKPVITFIDNSGHRVEFLEFDSSGKNTKYSLLRPYINTNYSAFGQVKGDIYFYSANGTMTTANTTERDEDGNLIKQVICESDVKANSTGMFARLGFNLRLRTILTPHKNGVVDIKMEVYNEKANETHDMGFIWCFDSMLNGNNDVAVKAIGDNQGMYIKDNQYQVSFLTKNHGANMDTYTAEHPIDSSKVWDDFCLSANTEGYYVYGTKFNFNKFSAGSSDAFWGLSDESFIGKTFAPDEIMYGVEDGVHVPAAIKTNNSGIFFEWEPQPLANYTTHPRELDFSVYLGDVVPPEITLDQKSTMIVSKNEVMNLSGTWKDDSTTDVADFYYILDNGQPQRFLTGYSEDNKTWKYDLNASTLALGEHNIQFYCINDLGMRSNLVDLKFEVKSIPAAQAVPQTVSLGTDISKMNPSTFVTNLSAGASVKGFAADGIPSTGTVTAGTPVQAKVVLQGDQQERTINVPVNVVYADSLAIPSSQADAWAGVLTLHHNTKGDPQITATTGNQMNKSILTGPFNISYYHSNDKGNIPYTTDYSGAYYYAKAGSKTTINNFMVNYQNGGTEAYPTKTVKYGDIVVLEQKVGTLYNDNETSPTQPAMIDGKRAYEVTTDGFVPLNEIPLGDLQLKRVDSIAYGSHKISSKAELYAPMSTYGVQIEDTRAGNKNWRLTVAQQNKFKTADGKTLQQSLQYKATATGDGTSLGIGNSMDIYTMNTSDTVSQTVNLSWNDQTGFFLPVQAGESLSQPYETKLDWALIEAP